MSSQGQIKQSPTRLAEWLWRASARVVLTLLVVSVSSRAYAAQPCHLKEQLADLLGANFLHQQNPSLHLTPEVKRAQSVFQQLGEANVKDPAKKIAAWLSVLKRTHSGKEELTGSIAALKRYYHREHVISEADFPESYFELQRRIAREQGHGDIVLTDATRAERKRVAITDQERSLDLWVEYLSSADATYPMWAKVWAFEGMTKVGKLDPATGAIVRRSASTVAPFMDLNREALSLTIEEMTKFLEAKRAGRAYVASDPVVGGLLQGGNFGKIYGRYTHLLTNTDVDFAVTQGAWVRYPRDSASAPLVRSLDCKNTGWCTAGASTAATQLKNGDFYVYYSLDSAGRPKNPRIAIRMEGERIAEVRGIGKSQELDSVMAGSEILPHKLRELGDEGSRYLKRSEDMKRLTQIEEKTRQGEALDESELRFLYELETKIEGFGYMRDPRIDAILSNRDKRNDLAFVYSVKPEEISFTREEALTGKSKIHHGVLNLKDLTSAAGLKLPDTISGGGLILTGLTSASGLKLPDTVNGYLDLSQITSPAGLKLPNVINGDLDLSRLTSAAGLRLPDTVNGNLYLGGLISAAELKLPDTVNGHLYLGELTSAAGLKLPDTVNGHLDLSKLTSTYGLKLPDTISGEIRLSGLKSAEGLQLPIRLRDRIYLRRGIKPVWVE